MANGVFITKVDPTYDDLPESRYHFRKSDLKQAQLTVGYGIVYYEPRRNSGRQSYFATARVTAIEPDPNMADHFYARMADYLEFPAPVPFRIGEHYFESALKLANGSVNLGLFQRAIHLLPENKYRLIVQAGLADDLLDATVADALMVSEPEVEYGRPRIESIVNRPLRDAAFQTVVRNAYDATCAMTGLKLINGGGKCEIKALIFGRSSNTVPIRRATAWRCRGRVIGCSTAESCPWRMTVKFSWHRDWFPTRSSEC